MGLVEITLTNNETYTLPEQYICPKKFYVGRHLAAKFNQKKGILKVAFDDEGLNNFRSEISDCLEDGSAFIFNLGNISLYEGVNRVEQLKNANKYYRYGRMKTHTIKQQIANSIKQFFDFNGYFSKIIS